MKCRKDKDKKQGGLSNPRKRGGGTTLVKKKIVIPLKLTESGAGSCGKEPKAYSDSTKPKKPTPPTQLNFYAEKRGKNSDLLSVGVWGEWTGHRSHFSI